MDQAPLVSRVTYDEVWEARKIMTELWHRQCRVCDFPGWAQAQKDEITEWAVKAQQIYQDLENRYWQQVDDVTEA